MSLTRRLARGLATTAMAAAIIASGATAASADVTTMGNNCTGTSWASDDDPGGRYAKAECTKNGQFGVRATFNPAGEHLIIEDNRWNGYSTMARIHVQGLGTRTFYGSGDGTTRDVNLSYSEGRGVLVQVCTSDRAAAICSVYQPDGRT